MTSTMSAAQLFVVAIVAVLAMSAWLTLVFTADRRPSAGHPRRGEAGGRATGGPEGAQRRERPAVPAPRPPADAPVPGAGRGDEREAVPPAVGSPPR